MHVEDPTQAASGGFSMIIEAKDLYSSSAAAAYCPIFTTQTISSLRPLTFSTGGGNDGWPSATGQLGRLDASGGPSSGYGCKHVPCTTCVHIPCGPS